MEAPGGKQLAAEGRGWVLGPGRAALRREPRERGSRCGAWSALADVFVFSVNRRQSRLAGVGLGRGSERCGEQGRKIGLRGARLVCGHPGFVQPAIR